VILVDLHGRLAVTTLAVPAAHSMDTTWYAVDAGGKVATCSSGEEGAVPYTAHRAYWETFLPELFVARLASASPADPLSEAHALHRALARATDPAETGLVRAILDGDAASRLVYADWLESHGRAADGTRAGSVFRFDGALRAIDPAALPAEEWPGILVFSDADFLTWFRESFCAGSTDWQPLDPALGLANAVSAYIPTYAFQSYWSETAIVTAYWINPYEVKPSDLGLYEYDCSFSGPYHRNEVPRRPLLVGDLPDSLRSRLAMLRIPQSFDSLPMFEPHRFADCQDYGV
jgi:uncharacterized protein (TIGR02996 family)